MEGIVELITKYGLETVVMAITVNVLTGIIKQPIKILAERLKDITRLTRYIVFLPIGLGFLVTYLYAKYIVGGYEFNVWFARTWLTTSSLSLTFYAIAEKIIPRAADTSQEREIGEKVLKFIEDQVSKLLQIEEVQEETATTEASQKLILRGEVEKE